jgi:hypothetical protein
VIRISFLPPLPENALHFRIAPKQLADHDFPSRAVAGSSGTSPQRRLKFEFF